MGTGLRERKKQQTREALSLAALRLVVERGLGRVLVEDIAAEAGVSARTFNNYFSSKAEAIVWRQADRVRRVVGLLRERPADEPLWDSLTAAVTAHFRDENTTPTAEWASGVHLMLTEPELQAEMLKAGAAMRQECAAAVAERTGVDAEHDLYPRLVAGAVGVAIDVACEQWLRADPPVPLADLARDALAQFAAGLPVPE